MKSSPDITKAEVEAFGDQVIKNFNEAMNRQFLGGNLTSLMPSSNVRITGISDSSVEETCLGCNGVIKATDQVVEDPIISEGYYHKECRPGAIVTSQEALYKIHDWLLHQFTCQFRLCRRGESDWCGSFPCSSLQDSINRGACCGCTCTK